MSTAKTKQEQQVGAEHQTAERRPRETRWSSRKKQDLVLRLLRGETLDALSRETAFDARRD
jgi:hypothetical protein